MNDRPWDAEKTHYCIKEQLCSLPRTKPALTHKARGKATQLSEAVHTHKDTIVTRTQRKIRNEVHRPTVKTVCRNGKWLEQTSRECSSVLHTLTCSTTSNKSTDIGTHCGPPDTLLQKCNELTYAKVGAKRGTMELFQKLPTQARSIGYNQLSTMSFTSRTIQ